MITVVGKAEIRPQADRPGAFDLVLDGQVFPHSLARQEVRVEHTGTPTEILWIPLYADSVNGVEAFNEKIADEDDAARVRRADRRDAVCYGFQP